MNKLFLICSIISLSCLGGDFDAPKLQYAATLSTTDGSTNTISSVIIPTNRLVRIEATILGKSSDTNHFYGAFTKIGTFAYVDDGAGGVAVNQIGGTASIGSAQNVFHFNALMGLFGTTNALIRVAGDTDKPMDWIAHVTVYYH